jgi:hypothetical protein
MPITKAKRGLYPPNWKELRAAVQARAGDRCEECGVRNGDIGFRDNTGAFHTVQEDVDWSLFDPDAKLITIVCTTAHLYDDDEETTDISRLKFMCQRCHNMRDAPTRAVHASATRRARKYAGQAVMEL